MPSESSSVVSNATNGIEPPRDHLSVKKSKKGTLKQVVPQYQMLKNFYTLLWDMPSNEGYIKVVAVMQKLTNQLLISHTILRTMKTEVPQLQKTCNTYKYENSYYTILWLVKQKM